jgi:hypothetical protein
VRARVVFDVVRRDQHPDWTRWGENDVSLRAHIRDGKNVVAGLLFAAIGLATAIVASEYPLGTMRSIGPG